MAREGALIVRRDRGSAQEWSIDAELVIGRDPECDICISDRQVSRTHAVIRREGDGFTIQDLSSKNGTWLNGERLTEPATLADGDEISVATRAKLYFVDAEATAPLLFERQGLRLDPDTLTTYVGGVALDPPLSGPQWAFLWMLYEADGAVVSRDAIISGIWRGVDVEGVSEDALDALVRRVRLRLAELDREHQYVVTVRGYGYRLDNVR